VSDVVAQLTGSVGLAGSANIGDNVAMFEAIHGSAPDIAGKGISNPSGLLLAGIMMLVHIGQSEVADKVHNAWLKTIEDGIHTGDIFKPDVSKKRVGTEEFTNAVIERLGQKPQHLKAVDYEPGDAMPVIKPVRRERPASKELVGVDVFLDWNGNGDGDRDPNKLGATLSKHNTPLLRLVMITNRGLKVWPGGLAGTFCTDHWRCRFEAPDTTPISHQEILQLLDKLEKAGFDFIKTENLYKFDGQIGYSLAQGQ
jgi:isocitrate dehydrogenase